MKITIYELLGLIKDNKAPKKIKYFGITYEFKHQDYKDTYNDNYFFSEEIKDITDILNDEVEIVEEDKKIEKLEYDKDCTDDWLFQELYEKVNEIIDKVNSFEKNEEK